MLIVASTSSYLAANRKSIYCCFIMMSEQCIAPCVTWSRGSWACFLSYRCYHQFTSNGLLLLLTTVNYG
jgi:hypothetical protein